MKKTCIFLAVAYLLGLQGWSEESQPLISSVSVGAGLTYHDDISIARFAIRRDSQVNVLENSTGWLSGYYEGSVSYWHKEEDHVFNFALSPVFVYYFGKPDWTVQPYVEAGIGVSAISETKIADRDMSTGFQFEDRVGVGLRTTDLDLSLRYMHYSNASIAAPNDGIDIIIVTVGYRF
jgi:lipid A 3-O-deacylase